MNANIKNATRREVYRRDGYRCALCDSSQGLQVHHAIPRGEGGTDSPQNLITLCSYCHSHAHGRPLYDTPITAQEIAQACVEYLADYYAPDWNPWRRAAGPTGEGFGPYPAAVPALLTTNRSPGEPPPYGRPGGRPCGPPSPGNRLGRRGRLVPPALALPRAAVLRVLAPGGKQGGAVPPSARARRAPDRRGDGPGEGDGRPAGRPSHAIGRPFDAS